jgi:hypothetical protein
MARGKQPSVSHALPKQQTLLDCFLEAQAKRTKRRRRSADAATSADPLRHPDDASALDEPEPLPAAIKTARAV